MKWRERCGNMRSMHKNMLWLLTTLLLVTPSHIHTHAHAPINMYIYMDVFTDIKASATTTNASPPRKNDFAKKIEDGLVPAHSSRVRVLLLWSSPRPHEKISVQVAAVSVLRSNANQNDFDCTINISISQTATCIYGTVLPKRETNLLVVPTKALSIATSVWWNVNPSAPP